MTINADTNPPNLLFTYEIADYVGLARAGGYVLVRHYRTVQGDGGQVEREPVSSTEELLKRMIRAYEGQVYESAGTINGFFADPEHTRNCAEAIFNHHGMRVELSGTQLSITL